MTLSEFITSIKGWLNREDLDDATVTSWVMMAVQDLSKELRIADQIQIVDLVVSELQSDLPADWQEIDFVKLQDSTPIRYESRDDFFNDTTETNVRYTIIGNYILFGGIIDPLTPLTVELSYYANVPMLTDDVDNESWITVKHLWLITTKTLIYGSAYGVEDNRAAGWKAAADELVAKMNEDHLKAKASGSRLRRKVSRGYV